MKPSPYFADTFRFFLKRFKSDASIRKWFMKAAGDTSEAFNFPADLLNRPKTLIFLPRDMEGAASFLNGISGKWLESTLFCAHESLHALISAKRVKAIYFSDLECRYGEQAFNNLMTLIAEFGPKVAVYLGEPSWPRLYLVKTSGASCRIAFDDQQLYPFLNISLMTNGKKPAEKMQELYGEK